MEIPEPSEPVEAEVVSLTQEGNKIAKIAADKPVKGPATALLESDNGFQEVQQKFYNIGPAPPDIGETVQIKPVTVRYAFCESNVPTNYQHYLKKESGLTKGKIDRMENDTGEAILFDSYDGTVYNVGPVSTDSVKNEVIIYDLEQKPYEHETTEGDRYAIVLNSEVWGEDRVDYYKWVRRRGGTTNSSASPPSETLLRLLDPCVGDIYIVELNDSKQISTLHNQQPIKVNTTAVEAGKTAAIRMFGFGRQKGVLVDDSLYEKDISQVYSDLAHNVKSWELDIFKDVSKDHSVNISDIKTEIEDLETGSTVESTQSVEENSVSSGNLEADVDTDSSGPSKQETRNPEGQETTSSSENTELDKLRKKAEQAASENPVKDTSVTSNSRRAPVIKKYAKRRAAGMCEYCGEPSPFETEEGDPYLEVHHVEELGEGGVDHPDKVVALCPTCHKEIHHGKRGSEINNELRKKLGSGLAAHGTGN